jgi:hypothetical protein
VTIRRDRAGPAGRQAGPDYGRDQGGGGADRSRRDATAEKAFPARGPGASLAFGLAGHQLFRGCRRSHAAQHDSFFTSPLNDWATSLSASLMVRYGAHVSARSSTVRPNLTA